MLRRALRRAAVSAVSLAGITVVTFCLFHLAPGDPLAPGEAVSRGNASPEDLERMRTAAGLDRPVWEQYGRWIGRVARGDLGRSLLDGEPVTRKIASRLPATLALGAASTLLAWGLALPFAVSSALRPGGLVDRGGSLLFYAVYSVPIFWAAIVLQSVFAMNLRWLPLHGTASDAAAGFAAAGRLADWAWHLVLPAVCLAYAQLAFLARFTRANLLEASGRPFVTASRARGLSQRQALLRHALPNAVLPLITIAGFTIPALAAGSVIVERIFSWPGVGRLLVDSIEARDRPTLMGLTLLAAVLTQAGLLAADLLYAAADPRMRHAGASP